jgi:two-component system, sensor histidine kinase RegB
MLRPADDDFGQRARQLRVDTLISLRWLAVAGQSAAVLVTRLGLGFELPIVWCFLCIGMSALLNFGLRLRFPVSQRLDDGRATIILGFDILQLAALLFLTGGVINPFSILFLAPVMISAASLPLRRTAALLLLALACSTVLTFWHLPLPWRAGADLRLPMLYGVAIWVAIAVGAAFITIYAHRVAQEARLLAGALNATERVLAREQHLSQLDGLAAAAAHELGTPLATVALVVTEMARQNPPAGAFADDLRLLNQEVGRCRAILGKLASLGEDGAGPLEELSLSHLVEEIAAPQRHFGVAIEISLEGRGPEPGCRRNPGMLYGLGNIAENAVDFADREVRIEASWTNETVAIVIADDGPGFLPHVLARLGEPYVTTRGAEQREEAETGGGLGLGLFIAKTLLERSGGALNVVNPALPSTGARVSIVWPRHAFEEGRQERQQPIQGGAVSVLRRGQPGGVRREHEHGKNGRGPERDIA